MPKSWSPSLSWKIWHRAHVAASVAGLSSSDSSMVKNAVERASPSTSSSKSASKNARGRGAAKFAHAPRFVQPPHRRRARGAARLTRRNRALRTASVMPRRSATTTSAPLGGAASKRESSPAQPTHPPGSNRRSAPRSPATMMSFSWSLRFSSGTVRSSERNARQGSAARCPQIVPMPSFWM